MLLGSLIEIARSGTVPEEAKIIAREEGISPEKIRDRIATGRIVVARNLKREGRVRIVGVGEGLRTKVNVNVGTSTTVVNVDLEVRKAKVAVEYGADTIMDLSTGGDLDEIRRAIMKASEPLPLGTVPIYQAAIDAIRRRGGPVFMSVDDIFDTVRKHLKDGVDFMTIHAGITKELALKAVKSDRVEPIVSRGGSILAAWMLHNDEENPFWKEFDYLLEMFKEYDAVISLGDALRPGAIVDAHDELQILELINNAKLVRKAREFGVQVMVEGPGHMPLDKIPADIKLMKRLTDGAPYYVLGPLVTDVSVGYDHIASAIGAAIAAAEGADLICYLTPAEHLSLPNEEQVKEGLIAAKIAAHAGDIVKLGDKVSRRDLEISIARAKLEWNKMIGLSLDPERARSIRNQYGHEGLRSCDMCGSLCVFLILESYRRKFKGG